MDDAVVGISRGPADTVLPEVPADWQAALDAARSAAPEARRDAVAAVAGRHPSYLAAWAELAAVARDAVEAYAYARVGYHRGLDALRKAGWRGSGYVRWVHPANRGFLRSLHGLQLAAAAIGEADEQQRCELFLHQCDPSWPPAELSAP